MKDKATKSDITHTIRRIARIWSAVIIVLATLVFIGEIIEATTTELEPYPFIENLIPLTSTSNCSSGNYHTLSK